MSLASTPDQIMLYKTSIKLQSSNNSSHLFIDIDDSRIIFENLDRKFSNNNIENIKKRVTVSNLLDNTRSYRTITQKCRQNDAPVNCNTTVTENDLTSLLPAPNFEIEGIKTRGELRDIRLIYGGHMADPEGL